MSFAGCKHIYVDWVAARKLWVCMACGKTFIQRGENPTIQRNIAAHVMLVLDAQAKIASESAARRTSMEGTTRDQFIEAMARRLMERRWARDIGAAWDFAAEILRENDLHFPDPSFDWSLAAARTLVDEYITEYGEGADQ